MGKAFSVVDDRIDRGGMVIGGSAGMAAAGTAIARAQRGDETTCGATRLPPQSVSTD